VTVGNRAIRYIISDDVPSQRRVILKNGVTNGQRLIIIVKGGNTSGGDVPGATTYGVSFRSSDANLTISGDANLEDGDTMELIWILDKWYELRRSVNDP
jgi:hypothetical protein